MPQATSEAKRIWRELQPLPPDQRQTRLQRLLDQGLSQETMQGLAEEMLVAPGSPLRRAPDAGPLNNPGNIKDKLGNFLRFEKAELGWQRLHSDLRSKISGRTEHGLGPTSTLLDLARVWAPAAEAPNVPEDWARNVASYLGVTPQAKIGEFRDRVDDLAKGVAFAEGTLARPAPKRGIFEEAGTKWDVATPAPPSQTKDSRREAKPPTGEAKGALFTGLIPFSKLAPERKPGEGPGMAAAKGLAGGTLQLLEDLSSPLNILLGVATGGMGAVARTASVARALAASPKLATAVQAGKAGLMAYFTGLGALHAGAESKKAYEAYADGDYEKAAQLLGAAAPGGVLTTLAAVGTAANWRPVRKGRGLQELRTQYIDEYAAIKDLSDAARSPMDESAYVAARNFAGVMGKIWGYQQDMSKIFRPAAKNGVLEPMKRYMQLEREIELASRFGAAYELPGGRTVGQAQGELAALRNTLGPARVTMVDTYATRARNLSNRLLDELQNAGIFDAGSVNLMKQANQKYVPFLRARYLLEEMDRVPTGGRTFHVARQDLIKKVQQEGSAEELLDPVQAWARNFYKGVALAERNKVARKVADLEGNANIPGVVREVSRTVRPGAGEGTFAVFKDGVKREYVAPKPVVEAMKGMESRDADFLVRLVGTTNEALKAGATTFYFPFIARNIIRDYETAWLRSPVGFGPITWVDGFATAVGLKPGLDRYMRSGAAFAGLFERTRSAPLAAERIVTSYGERLLKKPWTVVKTPFDAMRVLGEKLELTPRVGVFNRALRRGKSDAEAAFLAREVTVDFAKMGTRGRLINMLVPFSNARLQGTINMFKAFQERPLHSMMVMGAVAALPAAYLYVNNVQQYPHVWDIISDDAKDRNFIHIYGDKLDAEGDPTQVIVVPKGELGKAFTNPLENFLEYLYRRRPDDFSTVAVQFANEISPIEFARRGEVSGSRFWGSVFPPVTKHPIQLMANMDLYSQIPIVPERMKVREGMLGLGHPEQYRTEQPPWMIHAGRYLNISPLVLENMINTQFGGVGRLITQRERPDDITPEILKRTGLATVGRMFTEVRGRAEQERRFQIYGKVSEQERVARIITRRNAERIFNEIGRLPPQERPRVFDEKLRSGDLDALTLAQFLNIAKTHRAGLDQFERVLLANGTDVRASVLIEVLKDTPPEDRRALLQGWIKKKIVTDAVAKRITTENLEQFRDVMQAAPPPKANIFEDAGVRW